MTVLLANNVVTTLSGALTTAATDIVVVDGSRFPTPVTGEYFYATLVATNGALEIVKVMTRVGNSMGITRAQEGTVAQAFAAGSRVEMRITAATIRDAIADAKIMGTAPPTTGAWTRNTIVWNSAPSAGGVIGWVCVSSGTPGTWKSFGTIAA